MRLNWFRGFLICVGILLIGGFFVVRWMLGPPRTTREDQRTAKLANSSPLRKGLPGYPKPTFEELDDGKSVVDGTLGSNDPNRFSSHSLTVTWTVLSDLATAFQEWATLIRADGWVIDTTVCNGSSNWDVSALKSSEPKMYAMVRITPDQTTFSIDTSAARNPRTFTPQQIFDPSCPTLHP